MAYNARFFGCWIFVRFLVCDLCRKKINKSQISLHIKSLKILQSSGLLKKHVMSKKSENCPQIRVLVYFL